MMGCERRCEPLAAGPSTRRGRAGTAASTWRGPGRRQDVRDARRGAPPAGTRHRRGRGGGGDPRPQQSCRAAGRYRDHPAALHRLPGRQFPELDVAAVLARHPQVVLVDELAHTNTPGSTNPKRWQDVEEMLDAGITVISTVNVQHLESLNDVVAQITGIEQQETVPDEVVRARRPGRAGRHHAGSVAPQACPRQRVCAGEGRRGTDQLLPPRQPDRAARAGAAVAGRPGRRRAGAKYRAEHEITDTWEARERVVVAVTGGPESETLVRRACRIASKSSAELMVVHVVRGDGLSGVSAPQMGKVRELAASLGAPCTPSSATTCPRRCWSSPAR